jgi:hypothetical protein
MVTRKLHLIGCTAAKEAFLVFLRVQGSKHVENSRHDVRLGFACFTRTEGPTRAARMVSRMVKPLHLISHMQASSFLFARLPYADHRPALMRHLMLRGAPNVDLSADRDGPGSTVE